MWIRLTGCKPFWVENDELMKGTPFDIKYVFAIHWFLRNTHRKGLYKFCRNFDLLDTICRKDSLKGLKNVHHYNSITRVYKIIKHYYVNMEGAAIHNPTILMLMHHLSAYFALYYHIHSTNIAMLEASSHEYDI